ncbi:MAG: hypothetical protein R2822_03700 [Spirosomataceae bacterium]
MVKQTPDEKKEKAPRQFLAALMSLEGFILTGALLIAAAIVAIWLFWMAPSPQKEIGTKDSTTIQPLTHLAQIDTLAQTPTNNLIAENKKQEIPAEQEPIRLNPINPTPVKQRQPVQNKPINTQPEKPKDEPPAPPKEEEKPKEEKPKEEKLKEEPKPVRKATVTLGSEALAIQFMETISSDDAVGKMVLLQTISAVTVEGHVVIPQGAKVRGRITDARSGSDSKRAFLAIRFEAVQAANGEWVPLKYPEYSDKASSQVVFQAGRRVNNVRTTRTQLTVTL